jgi:SAM-dependent methyltransferase
MNTDLVDYYARRAAEYEQVYDKPERQSDLRHLHAQCASIFPNLDVLEVACGTGYWTESIVGAARSVLACDINPAVLEIARSKAWSGAQVRFVEADSYALPNFGRRFGGAFAGFWWSHIPRVKLRPFLAALHSHLEPGAQVMFVDNRYVPGSSTPVSRTDENGETYQLRRLAGGSEHEVLKNFPSADELTSTVAPWADDPRVEWLEYFWVLRYRRSLA